MKPSSAKQKGRLLQQYVASVLLERFPDLTSDDVRSTPMGVRGADVQLSARAKRRFPYAVECKAVEKLNMWTAWEQAQSHQVEGLAPLLVCRRNRTAPVAVIRWDDFVELITPTRNTGHADLRAALEAATRALDALEKT